MPLDFNNIEWEPELGRVAVRIGELQNAYDRAYELDAALDSIRVADDVATRPLAIGNYVQYCLVQAIDMCQGIAELVTNETGLQIPLSSTYPLARAAIESSSAAVWMLAPSTRRERVIRRLQAAHEELVFEKAFIHSAAEGQPPSQQQRMKRTHAVGAKQLKKSMQEVAGASGIDSEEYVNRMPSWREIVEAAAPVLHGERRSLLVGAWRFTSGLTHPSSMRGQLAHEFAPGGSSDEEHRGEVTASLPWLVSTAFVAEALTRRTLMRFAVTKARIDPETPSPKSPRG